MLAPALALALATEMSAAAGSPAGLVCPQPGTGGPRSPASGYRTGRHVRHVHTHTHTHRHTHTHTHTDTHVSTDSLM
ncbi:hypothetical protein EYF80_067565 [Liparis tanakae]|uniref:Secreted protein n=1 Tax=Liparis tanakae TaxID=230148 RepID=A0A4Z2E0K8_9TELE|nr:hypothetical protein EYF80_067565 [Liparis tanakae]